MGRGLSRQQRHILGVLRTKSDPFRRTRGAFSTDEVIAELHWEYKLWLIFDGLATNPGHPRGRYALRPYEKWRISVHRALQALERRGLVVSFVDGNTRYWAVPHRLDEWEKEMVALWSNAELREERRQAWLQGWRVRRMSPMERLAYRLGLATR